MENLIKFNSRVEGVHSYIELLGDTKGLFFTDAEYITCTLDKDTQTICSIDPEGGPMLTVGDFIKGDRKVKSITSCYLICFENDISSNKSEGII